MCGSRHCPRRWAGQRCLRPAAAARGGGAGFTQLGAEQRAAALSPPGRWGDRGPGGGAGSARGRGGPPEGGRALTESLLPAGAREGVIGRATGTRGWKKRGQSGGGVGAPSLQRCWWFLSGITFPCRAPGFHRFSSVLKQHLGNDTQKESRPGSGVCEGEGPLSLCPIWGTPRGFLGPVLPRRHPRPGFLRETPVPEACS